MLGDRHVRYPCRDGGAVGAGHVTPATAGDEDEEDPVDDLSVVGPPPPHPWLRREKRTEVMRLLVGELCELRVIPRIVSGK